MKNIKVVGIAFIKDGKLLISHSRKSSKQNKYTFVGGGVEPGETIYKAATRECKEEIDDTFNITGEDFELIMSFTETAASDPNLLIDMNILLATKEIDVELKPNDEIIKYEWFSLGDDMNKLSDSISKHFIPYAEEKKLMYK